MDKEDIQSIAKAFDTCFDYDNLYLLYNLLYSFLKSSKFTADWKQIGDRVDIARVQIAQVLGKIQNETGWKLLEECIGTPKAYLIAMSPSFPHVHFYPVYAYDKYTD